MVGDHAPGAARRHVGAQRHGNSARAPIYGRVTITPIAGVADEFTTHDDLSRTRAPARRCTRTGRVDRLHRLPVARPLVDGRPTRFGAARSDVRRSRLAHDGRPLVHRRLRRARHRREARARRRANRACSAPIARRCAAGAAGAGAEDLRRQPAGVAAAARYRSRPRRHRVARRQCDAGRRHRRGRRRRRPPRRARAICSWPARRGRRRSRSTTRSTASRSSPTGRWRASAARTFPKMLAQFEAWALQQRRRRQARLPRRHRARRWSTRRGAWRNTPPPTTTTTSSSSAALNEATGRFTPNVDGPNPARKGSATTSATSGWWRTTRRRGGRQAGADAAGARAPAGDRAALHAVRSDGGRQ